MDKEKKQQINEWIDKGAEWCAKKLYDERKRRAETLGRYRGLKFRNSFDEARDTMLTKLKNENDNLHKVLKKNGIRTRKLIVQYYGDACSTCPFDKYEDDCYWGCEVAGPVETELIDFYTFEATNECLTGITGDLKNFFENDCIRIIDAETNIVLLDTGEEEGETE